MGVCTKTPQTSALQDLQLTYVKRLCQLAHALGADAPLSQECAHLVLESTFSTLTNVNFDDERLQAYLQQSAEMVLKMEAALAQTTWSGPLWCCAARPAGAPPPPAELPLVLPDTSQALTNVAAASGLLARSAQVGNEDLFGVLEMAIYGMKGVCAYLYHAEHLKKQSPTAYSDEDRLEVFKELFRIGAFLAEATSSKPNNQATALNKALEECLALGGLNIKVMKILDSAHCHVLGSPQPSPVNVVPVGDKPSILVSGHDLGILKTLLEQCQGKGLEVFTHGEMLPAHGYPGLKKFPHLKGHFGTHWGNQLREFRAFPGAILMTSNCLRPPTKKYADRIWTSGPVGFTGIPNITGEDYSPVINKALELAKAPQAPVEPQGKLGGNLMTGFAHEAVLGVADKVVGAIKAGELKHVFVIGGCDGTETARSYFTDIAAATPQDSIILTLGCGKFRLLGHDHGTVAGLPRLLDLGQCNDAYSGLVIAQKLAEALGCGLHDLPLHFAISWFEQKAVAVLLSLLHLNLKNIRIGPAVPAFLTPKVCAVLKEKFGLMGIDAEHDDEDLDSMLLGK